MAPAAVARADADKAKGTDPLEELPKFYASATYRALENEKSKYWWFSLFELSAISISETSNRRAAGRDSIRGSRVTVPQPATSTRVLANPVVRRRNASFPMIGKYFSNGWKISAVFPNDWQISSRVFQQLAKFFGGAFLENEMDEKES